MINQKRKKKKKLYKEDNIKLLYKLRNVCDTQCSVAKREFTIPFAPISNETITDIQYHKNLTDCDAFSTYKQKSFSEKITCYFITCVLHSQSHSP